MVCSANWSIFTDVWLTTLRSSAVGFSFSITGHQAIRLQMEGAVRAPTSSTTNTADGSTTASANTCYLRRQDEDCRTWWHGPDRKYGHGNGHFTVTDADPLDEDFRTRGRPNSFLLSARVCHRSYLFFRTSRFVSSSVRQSVLSSVVHSSSFICPDHKSYYLTAIFIIRSFVTFSAQND